MLFNSLLFLFGFLPFFYFGYWQIKGKNRRYIWLTIAGYVFYSAWNYKFCALMAFSTAVSYFAGRGLLRWEGGRKRTLCLVVPIALDLALLGFFKYFNFGLLTVHEVASWLNYPLRVHLIDVVLPIGISFYTFHTITYIVDGYRRVITPTRNFFEFACYVSFFPQLVAGPIVRFRQVEADLEKIDNKDRKSFLNIGWSFLVIGLIKKVLLADSIAAVIDPLLANYGQLSTAATWLAVLGYSYQLYFDFSGYSDMAVGLGHLFGIRLPQNFDSPYKSVDIADFWRRWHISLSSCLRDYIYFPLGGSRGKEAWLTYRNLLITMLLGGLWHGANWTFVFWGGYHGVLLSLNRAFKVKWEKLPHFIRVSLTFLLVVIGWVFFRSDSFAMALHLLGKMFSVGSGAPIAGLIGLTLGLLVAAGVAHLGPNTFQMRHDWKPIPTFFMSFAFVLCLVVIASGQHSPFLYFQF